MKRVDDLIPWKVTDISFRPFKGMWSFNPSIHYDGDVWRCVLRCSDYAMPDGIAIRSPGAVPGESRTKNAMVILDPVSWRPVEIYKMRERDKLRRVACPSTGYEDIRIFRTAKNGLQGIAASLHLQRDERQRGQLAEQVLISFDAEYNIVAARPIRGSWSATPQKNWAPFENCVEPRFLYSINGGTLFSEQGPVGSEEEPVRYSLNTRIVRPEVNARASRRARKRAEEQAAALENVEYKRRRSDRQGDRSDPPQEPLICEDLRGGTQLVRIGEDAWLGIGHGTRHVGGLKYYWHVWYLVDARGKLISSSMPVKLAPNGIEFAAGMAVVGDRVVVSFGVDDMRCKIGETSLSAVLGLLHKIGAA